MDAQQWNRFLIQHAPASGAFLQSWEWGQFQEAVGRQVRRFSSQDAVAQAVSRPMPGGFFCWDLFRGPVGDGKILETVIAEVKKTKAVFVHGEPNTADVGAYNHTPLPAAARQPQHTVIVDLTQSDETLLATMHEKTRYNIRLAEKKGVIVREVTGTVGAQGLAPTQWDRFFTVMQTTAGRDRFHLHPHSYYEAMLKTLAGDLNDGGRCTVHLFIAEYEGDLLAGLIMLRFGNTATYLHGASADMKRNFMAPHFMQWEAMRAAKANGCTAYDFWGVAPPDSADHPWAGITRFKTGFGGKHLAFPPAWELPLRPLWYRLYRLIKRRP